jgi:hypothetical protein
MSSSVVTCKELIDIFSKVGGSLVCTYDTRRCTLLPQNVSCKILPENKVDIGSLLCDFAYSGEYRKCVTTFPESEQSKERLFVQDKIHDYQEKGVGGFVIKLVVDADGRWSSPPSPQNK